MKFTRKPITIEAVWWNGELTDELAELIGLRLVPGGEPSPLLPVPTRAGVVLVPVGHWIVRGPEGLSVHDETSFAASHWNTAETTGIRNCARCGGAHGPIIFEQLERPFAPPEAGGLRWTHWAPCPVNGQPIMQMTVDAKVE